MANKKVVAGQAEEVFQDYETQPVPEEKRTRWYSQGMVWAGSAFCLPAFSIGATLAANMSFGSFMVATLIGSAILTLVAALIGVIGAKTHLPSAFTSRFALGTGGSKVFGLVVALSLFGWFGFQCSYFASSTIATLQLFGLSGGSMAMWTIIGGLAMMITAVIGFKGIKVLSNFGVPLLFALVAIAFIVTCTKTDMATLKAASAASAGKMGIPAAVVTVVGSFIAGACIVPDFSRYSKYPKDAAYGSFLGFMISFPLILVLGAFFYYAYASFDLCQVFIQFCGLGFFAAIVLILSTWTTNDNNLYSSVLGISNAIGNDRIPRWLLTVIVGVVSTLLGVLGLINYFLNFLNLLGVLIPPFAGAIIADYFLYGRKNGSYDFANADKVPTWNVGPCVAAVVGMIVGLLCNYTGILSFLTAICPASILAILGAVATLAIYNACTKKN